MRRVKSRTLQVGQLAEKQWLYPTVDNISVSFRSIWSGADLQHDQTQACSHPLAVPLFYSCTDRSST